MSIPDGFDYVAVISAFASIAGYVAGAYLLVCAYNIVADILRERR